MPMLPTPLTRLPRIWPALVLCMAAVPLTPAAAAGKYPDRPIRVVVPYAPGGSTDFVARLVASRLAEGLGQSVVVENRGGAGGKLGIDQVAKSTPDGYTLLFTDSGSMLVNAWLFDRGESNPVQHFATIGQIAMMQNVLVAHPSAGIRNLKDLAARAKREPVTYGSSGTGTLGHLGMEMLGQAMNIERLHVPYKGGAPLTNDLLGGQVPLAAVTVPTAAPHIKSGRVVAVAALSEARSQALPDVPTVAEQGYPPVSAAMWLGLYAPAGTPRPILEQLNQRLRHIAQEPASRERMVTAGNEVTGTMSLDEANAYVKREYTHWGEQIKALGLPTP